MNSQTTSSNMSLWAKIQNAFFSDHNKNPRRKLFNTLWAVLFGFIISGLVISFSGYNPFLVFAQMFIDGSTTFDNKLISIFVAYLIAALAVAFCFKSGLFNIGISGQMMLAGFTTLLIFKKLSMSESHIVLAIFIAIMVGALLSLLAGLLKIYFGINEVVSTIMLNWVVFFIIKFVVINGQGEDLTSLSNADSLASNLSVGYIMPSFFHPNNANMSWYSNNWNWVILSIALLLIISIAVIFSKTSLGYKIKMVGLNKDAADYSGTNKKSLILIVMSISGALSGFAGFIWYVGTKGQIDISEQPLGAGFDAIAISLLAFNNPIGIGLSSFVYGILNVGAQGIHSEFVGLPREINEVIVGLMVYVAAISVVFTKLNGAQWIKNFFVLSPNKKYRSAKVVNWSNNISYVFSWFTVRSEIISLWSQNHSKWRDIKKQHHTKVKKIEQGLLQRYNSKSRVFNVEMMNENDQIKYFNTLAKLKKEADIELAEAKYFEKNNVKARRLEKYKKTKQQYQKIRNSIINARNQYVGAKKIIKKSKNMNQSDAPKIEEQLIVYWKAINQIDLKQNWIESQKIIDIKNEIVQIGNKFKLTNLVYLINQSPQEGGK